MSQTDALELLIGAVVLIAAGSAVWQVARALWLLSRRR